MGYTQENSGCRPVSLDCMQGTMDCTLANWGCRLESSDCKPGSLDCTLVSLDYRLGSLDCRRASLGCRLETKTTEMLGWCWMIVVTWGYMTGN